MGTSRERGFDWQFWAWVAFWPAWAGIAVWGLLQVFVLNSDSPSMALLAFMLFVVGLPYWFVWRERRRRASFLEAFCAKHGLSLERDPPLRMIEPFVALPLFQRGEPERVTNCVRGTYAGRAIIVFEYTYITLAVKGRHGCVQTVAIFPAAEAPPLQILPKIGLLDRAGFDTNLDFATGITELDPTSLGPALAERYRAGAADPVTRRALSKDFLGYMAATQN